MPVQAKELCMVEKAYTGDTFICSDGSLMKLWGVKAPRIPPLVTKAEPKGEEAKDVLDSYLKTKSLMCEHKDTDKTGKYYQCFLNQVDVSIKMLEEGLVTENEDQSDGYYKEKMKPAVQPENPSDKPKEDQVENKSEVKSETPASPEETKPGDKLESLTPADEKVDENKPEVKPETPAATEETKPEVKPETPATMEEKTDAVKPDVSPAEPVQDK